MSKDIVEPAMGAGRTGVLGYDQYQTRTAIQAIAVTAEVAPLFKKRQKDPGGFKELILFMHIKRMSTQYIQHYVKGIYPRNFSIETVSRITDAIIANAEE